MNEAHWTFEEDKDCWKLFFHPKSELPVHPFQILKAPKHSTPFKEYWPDKSEAKFIIDALNKYQKEIDILNGSNK